MADLKVTQFKSAIGSKPKQRGTLRALGLGRIGKTNTLPDRPEIRGMLAKVPHLVRVEASASSRADGASASESGGDGPGAQPRASTESEA